jgi:hypothetical protein
LPQPCERTTQFEDYVDKIYVEMTARRVEVCATSRPPPYRHDSNHVSPNQISGLIEARRRRLIQQGGFA